MFINTEGEVIESSGKKQLYCIDYNLGKAKRNIEFPFSKLIVGMQLSEFMKTWITSLQGLFQGSSRPKF